MRSNKELTIPNLGLLLGIPLCGMIYRLMVLYIQYIYAQIANQWLPALFSYTCVYT